MDTSFRIFLFGLMFLMFTSPSLVVAHEFTGQHSLVSEKCKSALQSEGKSISSRTTDFFYQFDLPQQCSEEEVLLFDKQCEKLTSAMKKKGKVIAPRGLVNIESRLIGVFYD